MQKMVKAKFSTPSFDEFSSGNNLDIQNHLFIHFTDLVS